MCFNRDDVIIQDKNHYEKIGEPTEVALKVLAEKLNVCSHDRQSMTPQEKACAVFNAVQDEYEKEFTLEFSRDRKSMSVYCRPREGEAKPVMFVKVSVCSVRKSIPNMIHCLFSTPGCTGRNIGSLYIYSFKWRRQGSIDCGHQRTDHVSCGEVWYRQ